MTFLKAKYISDYIIEVEFTNGAKKYYDFKKWMFEMCQPNYYKFRKLTLFKKVRVKDGVLFWGKREMDFLPSHIKEFEIKKTLIASLKTKRIMDVEL
jgi:Protein of unknown function (DUF2442)